MNQDPSGEEGGINLYSICTNNLFLYFDYLGKTKFLHNFKYGKDGYFWKPKKEVKLKEGKSSYPSELYYPQPNREDQKIVPGEGNGPMGVRMEDLYDWDKNTGRWKPRNGHWDSNGRWIPNPPENLFDTENEGMSLKCLYCRYGTGVIGAGLSTYGLVASGSVVGLPTGVVAWVGSAVNSAITLVLCEDSAGGVGASFVAGTLSIGLDHVAERKALKGLKNQALRFRYASKALGGADIVMNLGSVFTAAYEDFIK